MSYWLLNGIQTRHLNKNISLPTAPNSHKYKNVRICICVKFFCEILHIHAFCTCICCVLCVCTGITYFMKKSTKGFDPLWRYQLESEHLMNQWTLRCNVKVYERNNVYAGKHSINHCYTQRRFFSLIVWNFYIDGYFSISHIFFLELMQQKSMRI